jgi:hypothetical protein
MRNFGTSKNMIVYSYGLKSDFFFIIASVNLMLDHDYALQVIVA